MSDRLVEQARHRVRTPAWDMEQEADARCLLSGLADEVDRLRDGITRHRAQQGGCGGHYDAELWALLGDNSA